MSGRGRHGERLGEELLLENDRVRVWQDRVPPGGEQPQHTHRNPYLSVVVRGADGEVVADGEVLYEMHREPGDARWFGPDRVPVTHTLRNTGTEEILVVVVEVLDPQEPSAVATESAPRRTS